MQFVFRRISVLTSGRRAGKHRLHPARRAQLERLRVAYELFALCDLALLQRLVAPHSGWHLLLPNLAHLALEYDDIAPDFEFGRRFEGTGAFPLGCGRRRVQGVHVSPLAQLQRGRVLLMFGAAQLDSGGEGQGDLRQFENLQIHATVA